ncbi:MAG: S8 family serine peptidase, partial [Deltaproteobacteria bacterium]|nr:S8 family serine peptidase [Deltaproteobacteria bacterium]
MKTIISLVLVSFVTLVSGSFVCAEEILRQEGELIIKFKAQSQSGEEDILKVLADIISFHHLKNTLEEEKEVKVLNSYAWANIHHVQIPEGETLEHMIEEIKKLDEVEYVEPNYLFHVGASTEAMDYQEAAVQSSASSGGTQSGQALASGGQSVTVAVIDTGVDYTHKAIAPYMWVNTGEIPGNGKDDDGNGYVDDINGYDFVNNDSDPYDDHYHGTHVSGIVLSLQDSLNPVIKIMALKFLSKDGYGSTGDAIRAIDYAIKNGAKVLNNSWGGGGYSQALSDAIVASYNANRVFVVAAGNSSIDVDQYTSYPPSYLIPNMITVAALDSSTNLAWFSNYGPISVHVGAPGVSIYSTLPHQKYGYLSGTSMATPYVAGVAAMMLSQQPELMHLQVKKII